MKSANPVYRPRGRSLPHARMSLRKEQKSEILSLRVGKLLPKAERALRFHYDPLPRAAAPTVLRPKPDLGEGLEVERTSDREFPDAAKHTHSVSGSGDNISAPGLEGGLQEKQWHKHSEAQIDDAPTLKLMRPDEIHCRRPYSSEYPRIYC